tara:strand:+ start:1056 stop:2261 length:1206 start_codon:yes stop_codon:yes gene_type:complete
MKIIIFTEKTRFGGLDLFIINLIKNWPNDTDSFTVICNENSPNIAYLNDNLPERAELICHSIPLNWSFLSIIIRYLPNILQRIFRQIIRILLIPYQYFKIYRLLKSIDSDALISVNGSYPGGETCRWANIIWHKLGRGRSIHNVHNFAIKPRFYNKILENYIDGILFKSVSMFVGVSKSCSSSLLIRKSFHDNKLTTIYNGIELNNNKSQTIRDILNLTSDIPIVMMIGTYEERKGHKFLFQSMRYVYENNKKIQLVIIGSGTKKEKKNILTLIDSIIPDVRVHLLGEYKNAGSLIKGSNVLVIPSQDEESFGLPAVEAMLSRVPVITTNIGGLPETIGLNSDCGYVVDSNDPIQLSEKILYLIDNPEISHQMGVNGSKRAKEYFSPGEMSKNYHRLLNMN